MKQRKTEVRFFNIVQWEEEQEYLRLRHGQGWALDWVSFPGVYHFVRCEPEDMVYQLDYNQEGRRCKEAYVQMFADCGWEYLQDFVGYSYFRKPKAAMKGREDGIFCDDASRLDLMVRVFQGRMIPTLVILVLVILPQLYLHRHPATTLDAVSTGVFGGLLAVYLVIFLSFGRKLWQYKTSLKL